MTLRHRRPRILVRRSGRNERGAVIVEMAIVAAVLLMLLAGAFDFGMGWRASLGVNEAARGGARVGSGLGKNEDADRIILTSMQSTLAASGLLDDVDRVVIFSAQGTNGKPSTACINGTGGTCNTFTGDQFRKVTMSSPVNGDYCIQDSQRRSWCPKNRQNVQLNAQYLGVWVRTRYPLTFRLFTSTLTIERSAIMRIEPPDVTG